jgi:hypothetical protein
MAYITLSNTNKIIFKTNLKNLNLAGELYKIPIYFFSKYEENALLAIKELLKNPEKYFNEIYIPYVPVDTLKFVYEGKNPSYHKFADCPRLHSVYENFEIPTEIRELGKEKINEFRIWFETVKHLLDEPEKFVMRLRLKWGIETNPNAIIISNSGSTEIENLNIEDLERKIDLTIKNAGKFYYENEKNKTILHKFSKFTYLAYKAEKIEKNETIYSDEEIKILLKDYDNKFKRPLKGMLIEYYRLKHNPNINFEGTILEKLGFKQCGHCHNQEINQRLQEIFK